MPSILELQAEIRQLREHISILTHMLVSSHHGQGCLPATGKLVEPRLAGHNSGVNGFQLQAREIPEPSEDEGGPPTAWERLKKGEPNI